MTAAIFGACAGVAGDMLCRNVLHGDSPPNAQNHSGCTDGPFPFFHSLFFFSSPGSQIREEL